jgi:hypothetical protein
VKKFAILASLAAAVAFLGVSLAPPPAEAGWCRKVWRDGYYSRGYCGRRFVGTDRHGYVRPRAAYYTPRRCRSRYGCGAYSYAYFPYWRSRTEGGWYYR